MNLFYAAILVCWQDRCWSLTDDFSPYATVAECRARLEVMKSIAIIGFGHLPGVVMVPNCGSLDEIRRDIPGAFPWEAAT